jgi:PKD repeat protein
VAGQYVFIDDDTVNGNNDFEELIYYGIDCEDYENVMLDFDGFHNSWAEDSYFDVDINNGGGWTNVYHSGGDIGFGAVGPHDISLLADGETIDIRFVFDDNDYWAYGAAVDNVLITGDYNPAGAALPTPQNVSIIGNYFFDIGESEYYAWDNPAMAPYPGIMVSLDETYPGAADGDADQCKVHYNIFDNDCHLPVLAVINKDPNAILDCEMNWWGTKHGPASYPELPGVIDAITGVDIADANDFSSAIVEFGPVHFTPFIGLKAIATASATSVDVGDVVLFDGSDSWAFDMNGDPIEITYFWDFDDGLHSIMESPTHVYDTPGTYKPSLRIMANGIPLHTNMMFDWDFLPAITVTSAGAPLAANADGGDFGGYETIIGEPVQLYGVASGGEEPYVYSWDLGNGETSNEQNPIALYDEPGTYTVTLTVIDQGGRGETVTDTAQVTVHGDDELIIHIIGQTVGIINDPVYLYSDVIGGRAPYTYLWDFGDGQQSGLQDTIHTYTETGTYTVQLTVTDSVGNSITETTTVEIDDVETNEVEILNIKGGLGISSTIKAGDSLVAWTIDVSGRVFLGGHGSGTIPAGASETVRLPFTFGFGNVDITVTANSVSEQKSAFMLGPFVFIK